MPSTLLQAMIPGAIGGLFFESFEGNNWQSDQGWTVVQGSPANSSNAAFDGLKSYIMDSTKSAISKQIAGIGFVVAYFYDDVTQTQAFTPFFFCTNTNGTVRAKGIGVNTAIVTLNYTLWNGTTYVATTVNRTTGWHRLTFNPMGGITIDGTSVDSLSFTATGIQVGYDTFNPGASTVPFGFFDFIQVSASKTITVKNLKANQQVTIFNDSFVQVGTGTVASGQTSVSVDTSAQNSPFNGYFVVTDVFGNPFFYSDTSTFRQLFTGDQYSLYVLDFGRRVTSFDIKRMVSRQDKESTSGRNEGIEFYARDTGSISLQDLTDDQRSQIMAFWTYAQQAKQYSLAIDSRNLFYSRITVAVSQGDTVVNLNSATGLQKGSRILLSTFDNARSEEATVSSVTSNTATLNSPTMNGYAVNDICRSRFYWPQALNTDKALNLSLSNVRLKRWNWTHTFKEAL